jgi:Phospholipase_D-nuclease N-terminal
MTFHLIIAIVLGIAFLALWVGAVVSITASAGLSATAKAVWILIALIFPVLGPLVWFVSGRSTARTPAAR